MNDTFPRRPAFLRSIGVLVAGFASGLLPAADAPVTARLSIPPAETHVIGDPITLSWHFTNPTARPMAFVWEACCRLNGRLTVSQDGVDLPRIPPGPAAAHAFAKPAIILPGRENAFESMLADWVLLRESGRYELRGRYVGVLPEQKPPYPPSVGLWRGEAETAPVAVELLGVDDYLAQRPARAARRGLEAAVTGPAHLPPTGPATFRIRIRNTASRPQTLTWPLDADLWITDDAGMRVYRSPSKPSGNEQVLQLESGAEAAVEFPLSAADLNGSPFGTYRVFIDFPATTDLPRVPSAPQTLRWNLGESEVATLLNEATTGTKTAARNAPLLLMRRYLASLEPALDALPAAALSPPAQALRRQLQLAACLRQLPADAGRITLGLDVAPGGGWRLNQPAATRCANGVPLTQLQSILGARRHLGLEVAVDLRVSADASVADALRVAADLETVRAELAAPPRSVARAAAASVPGSVAFTATPPPAHLVLRLQASGGNVIASAARSASSADEPTPLTAPSAFDRLAYATLGTPSDLERLLQQGKMAAPQVVIVAATDARWSAVEPWLQPFLQRGWQVDLTAADRH